MSERVRARGGYVNKDNILELAAVKAKLEEVHEKKVSATLGEERE
ncbi:MAG: hypothetical protein Kow0069_02180 [Promethearchaeota archaeon]